MGCIASSGGKQHETKKETVKFESLTKLLGKKWESVPDFVDSEWKFYQVLGTGAFGKVVQVRRLSEDTYYALKVLDVKFIVENHSEAAAKRINTEWNLLLKLENPYFSNLVEVLKYQDRYAMFLMELSKYGSLHNVMYIYDDKVPVNVGRIYAAELITCVEYMHKHGIIHRDIRPDNILVHTDMHLKLTDIGYAADIGSSYDFYGDVVRMISSFDGPEDEGKGIKLTTKVGARGWKAPEMVLKQGYDYSVDYFCIGLVLFWILSGCKMPFKSRTTLRKVSHLGYENLDETTVSGKIHFVKSMDDVTRDLLSKLLEKDPVNRLGATNYGKGSISDGDFDDQVRFPGDACDIKAHPFFNGLDWDNLQSSSLPFDTFSPKIPEPLPEEATFNSILEVIKDIEDHDVNNMIKHLALF